MNEQFDQHKLAVIFYADIAGYSRLTARDERGTHQRVMSALDFASESIQGADGKVLRYAGDAILAEFPSILKAVQVAIDIQTELEKRNQPLPSDEGVQLRISLHFGEVLQDRSEIYGNSVNLAARLEAAAHPDGICISAAVHDQIRGKLEAGFIDGGLQAFKNIEAAVQVFHWVPGTNTYTQPAVSPTMLPLPAKPSIAILAFENMSNDPEQDFFAEGIGLV